MPPSSTTHRREYRASPGGPKRPARARSSTQRRTQRRVACQEESGRSIDAESEQRIEHRDGALRHDMADAEQREGGGFDEIEERRIEQDREGGVLQIVIFGPACRIVPRPRGDEILDEGAVQGVARRIAIGAVSYTHLTLPTIYSV